MIRKHPASVLISHYPVKGYLRYLDLEDRIFNRVISDISDVQRETTLTISDRIDTVLPVESEILGGYFFPLEQRI